MNTQGHQPKSIRNEIYISYFLQQHKINKNQLRNFTQNLNTAESLQMTINPYHITGSSKTSNKPFMASTGTDPEYSIED